MKFFEEIERKPLAKVDGRTKGDMAQVYGLESYDATLPQPWLNEWCVKLAAHDGVDKEEAYDRLMCGTVWCYDGEHGTFGAPFFLYEELATTMEAFD